jgi:hypothetical protein
VEETPPIGFPAPKNPWAGHTFMATISMVQAQNAKNMSGKFAKKKSETFNFFFKTLYLRGK